MGFLYQILDFDPILDVKKEENNVIDPNAEKYRINQLKEEEKLIIRNNLSKNFPTANTILKTDAIIKARDMVKEIYMDEKIEQYIIDIIFATRNPENYGLDKYKDMISFGSSPRGSINLAAASKAYAFIKRRGYVIPEDVRALCHDVLRHRIGISYEAEAENITSEDIINEILNVVEIP